MMMMVIIAVDSRHAAQRLFPPPLRLQLPPLARAAAGTGAAADRVPYALRR